MLDVGMNLVVDSRSQAARFCWLCLNRALGKLLKRARQTCYEGRGRDSL